MTYSMQLQKSKQETRCKELKLENPNISVESSLTFMKKLTVVAISTISYLRNIFPSSAFQTKKLNGTKVWLLKGCDDIPGTHTLINWVRSAYEAVRLYSLKKMVLVIEKQDGNETLETYSFNFTYNFDAISCEVMSRTTEGEMLVDNMSVPANIKNAVQQLLRSVLVSTQFLKPLPDNCEVSMQLEFNEPVTDDCELPEFFKAVDSSSINFSCGAHTLKLGSVESKFTGITLTTNTVLNKEMDDATTGPTGTAWRQTGLCNDELTSHPYPSSHAPQQSNNSENEAEEEEVVQSSQLVDENSTSFVNTPNIMAVGERNFSETISSVCLRQKEIMCICECNDELNAVIECSSCYKFQHKACYKLLDDQERAHHICVDCHEPNSSNKKCTDPDLVGNENRKFEALYRRALVLCLTSIRVSLNTFVHNLNLSRKMALKIFNKLDNDGFLRPPTGKRNIRTVKIDHLKVNGFNTYFGTSIHDQLELMETDENMPLRDINNTNDGNIRRMKRINLDDDYQPSESKRFRYARNQEGNNILV
uniref:HORMA domain-containing protein n=1 Tax=Graphocephala atropunctata TaxID=36148 RepID=A0A1B6MUA8_9HEMI